MEINDIDIIKKWIKSYNCEVNSNIKDIDILYKIQLELQKYKIQSEIKQGWEIDKINISSHVKFYILVKIVNTKYQVFVRNNKLHITKYPQGKILKNKPTKKRLNSMVGGKPHGKFNK